MNSEPDTNNKLIENSFGKKNAKDKKLYYTLRAKSNERPSSNNHKRPNVKRSVIENKNVLRNNFTKKKMYNYEKIINT